jgi:hypothetical protein
MGILRRLLGKKPAAPCRSSNGHVRSFGVALVQPARRPLPEWPAYRVVALHAGGRIEACSSRGRLVAPLGGWLDREPVFYQPLIDTLYRAWKDHHPVALSPDAIWLTLTQGLARHLQTHAAEFRDPLQGLAGQRLLVIRRDDFVFGSPHNAWPKVFPAFSEAVAAVAGSARETIVADFSTTGPVEQIASEVMPLSTLRPYVVPKALFLCGIPSITLEGTVQDWERLVQRVRSWEAFGLDWWLEHLVGVLEPFVAAARGQVDLEFWRSIFQVDQGCGRDYVSGWVINLFPYLVDEHRSTRSPEAARIIEPNLCLEAPWNRRAIALHQFGGGPGRAPFGWRSSAGFRDMEFLAGLVGIRQNPATLCLRPEIGWAVRQRPARAASANSSKTR